jgi:peptidoglycan/xylan/chitin deacetylase (PgdA/CDA1 family)
MNKTARITTAGLGLLLLAGGGWWFNEQRKVAIHDMVNPVYWVHRLRGEDLYDASTRTLHHGNRDLPEVALTIDDGPHAKTGTELLDILKQHKVHATFLVVGTEVKANPDITRRMVAEGHEVGNHSQDHQRLHGLTEPQVRHELFDCDVNFFRVTGQHLRLMRAPGERYGPAVYKVENELGYTIVDSNAEARDYDPKVSADFITGRIMRRVENGSIILLHDDNPGTVEALPTILDKLQAEGYRFVTASEMLAHLPHPVQLPPIPKVAR